jgi:putative protein-disulfide isomerase
MRLLYFADPLCSWCYGFGPELDELVARHEAAGIDLVMGGLRPYNTQPMSEAFKAMLREHWRHVHEASGLPFSEAILGREDFVYDTEPACRAVVTARALAPERAFDYLKAIQRAFYPEGRDMTNAGELADLAAAAGYNRAHFAEGFDSPAMRAATRDDFATSQSMEVAGFPTLALRHGASLFLVASGFAPADVLEERIAEIERRARRAQA